MEPSPRILALAQQLRLYRPPPPSPPSPPLLSTVDPGQHHKAESSVAATTRQKGTAAVLICLFEDDSSGDLRVILTKRSSRLSTHSGEVSLPGGKVEPGDTNDAETAIREAKEEIGLDPSLVNVVTIMEPFVSKYLLKVVPVIGILTDKRAFKPSPNPAEVEVIFDAPLEMFLKDGNRSAEEKEWMGEKYLMHYFEYESEEGNKYLIWGLTAWILIRAASIVYHRPPTFPSRLPKFLSIL